MIGSGRRGETDTVKKKREGGETAPVSTCERALCCGKYSTSHMRVQQLLDSGIMRRNLDLCKEGVCVCVCQGERVESYMTCQELWYYTYNIKSEAKAKQSFYEFTAHSCP